MSKFWKIHFALRKGDLNKYRSALKYVNDTYNPHYLTFSQQLFYDLLEEEPIPIIKFYMFAKDALHVMDDFIEHFDKVLMTGGAEPFKWSHPYKPTKREKEVAKILEQLTDARDALAKKKARKKRKK